MQGESKNASLLAFFAEPQPIFVIFEAKIVQGESKNASLLAFFCRAAAYLRDFCEAKIVQGENREKRNARGFCFFL